MILINSTQKKLKKHSILKHNAQDHVFLAQDSVFLAQDDKSYDV
jgi:hypothetical protein